MFHVGTVVKVLGKNDKSVIAADYSTQALLEMWDENIITLTVDEKLVSEIKEKDIVLVDYSPSILGSNAVPKHTITKILRGKTGEETLKAYERFHRERKKQAVPQPAIEDNPFAH
ncbi:MAG: hypothetical protein HY394_02050 [Candidatus Diapherotrites archaeon]|nr:hypothetical protein [Candidatus Diapherotrites archaeon]